MVTVCCLASLQLPVHYQGHSVFPVVLVWFGILAETDVDSHGVPVQTNGE